MLSKRKILIVEDEALIAMHIFNQLKKIGYAVAEPVATGERAVEVARETDPDVIIMDIHLAGSLDGIEAARRILEFRDMPIVFITGYSNPEDMQRAFELKPVAYLNKPLRIFELVSVLDSIFPKPQAALG